MNDEIFLLQDNEELVRLETATYVTEDVLQRLLARYPSLLPIGNGSTPDSPRLLLIAREASIPDDSQVERFALDHLFLDHQGIPTLVEVKRATDTRIRREVVAQMLDYASHFVVHWTVDRILVQFENLCQELGVDSEGRLEEFLEGQDEGAFWQSVKTNLLAGRVRLVFVADRIPPELRRIVEFLNNQMDSEHRIDKRPSTPIKSLVDNDSLEQYLAVWDWYLDEIRKANP